MKSEKSSIQNESIDLPTLFTVIFHLMTLYIIKPCEPLAHNIQRHIKVLLNYSENDDLNEWKATFQQLLTQWEKIANQHTKQTIQSAVSQKNDTLTH